MIGSASEQQIYSDGNVLVSTSRVIVFGVTYPLGNVSSVRLMVQQPNRALAFISGVVAIFALVGHAWLVGGIALLVCVGLFAVQKAEYIMLIGSSGGEKAALRSPNHSYVQNIVDHVNEAVVARG